MSDADPEHDIGTMFDQASWWRAEIIAEFRLRGSERCAAASPTPGFPQLLDSVGFALADAPPGPLLDVGGGLGGTASWIERTQHRDVVVLDASFAAVSAARQLFPELDVGCADAAGLPIRHGSVPAAIVSGVISLLADVDGLLAELRRVLAGGGRVAMTDLWSATSSTQRIGANTFWSLEDIQRRAEAHDFQVQHLAISDLGCGWWSSSAAQVNDEIVERHNQHPQYGAWREDLEHLDRVVASRQVVPAAMVLG
ncbi:MAG TPA: methyltransferase domain-containing protein [Ilumatobacteraceae bacterium]|nr:methyltransferase domain-containing protein [Ilumatobacteraceae bacterium]